MASVPGTAPAVSVVASPGSPSVWVRLAGDVDLVAEPALVETVDRLSGLAARLMIVDATAVTYAGSSLVHFLEALHRAHPHAVLVLRHSSPVIPLIVKVAGLDGFVVTSDDPRSPATWQGTGPEHPPR